ncbi:unnamed protein product, partial [Prorocentrum cordatum]
MPRGLAPLLLGQDAPAPGDWWAAALRQEPPRGAQRALRRAAAFAAHPAVASGAAPALHGAHAHPAGAHGAAHPAAAHPAGAHSAGAHAAGPPGAAAAAPGAGPALQGASGHSGHPAAAAADPALQGAHAAGHALGDPAAAGAEPPLHGTAGAADPGLLGGEAHGPLPADSAAVPAAGDLAGGGPPGPDGEPGPAEGGAEEALEQAFPEDLQKASLRMLQRHLEPGAEFPPELREAAASVERSGRLLQTWVKRRQLLAEALPQLGDHLEKCYREDLEDVALLKEDEGEGAEGAMEGQEAGGAEGLVGGEGLDAAGGHTGGHGGEVPAANAHGAHTTTMLDVTRLAQAAQPRPRSGPAHAQTAMIGDLGQVGDTGGDMEGVLNMRRYEHLANRGQPSELRAAAGPEKLAKTRNQNLMVGAPGPHLRPLAQLRQCQEAQPDLEPRVLWPPVRVLLVALLQVAPAAALSLAPRRQSALLVPLVLPSAGGAHAAPAPDAAAPGHHAPLAPQLDAAAPGHHAPLAPQLGGPVGHQAAAAGAPGEAAAANPPGHDAAAMGAHHGMAGMAGGAVPGMPGAHGHPHPHGGPEAPAPKLDYDCSQGLRIPAQVLVGRKAVSAAYWDFDRSLELAERKVGRALDRATVQ